MLLSTRLSMHLSRRWLPDLCSNCPTLMPCSSSNAMCLTLVSASCYIKMVAPLRSIVGPSHCEMTELEDGNHFLEMINKGEATAK
jgi:hypothetical protein